MIVSTLQSIRCFCEHGGEDGPADAWQRIEDRHVTMLLPLSRHVLPIIPGDGLGELPAKAVELHFCISQLPRWHASFRCAPLRVPPRHYL
jgi:hypothetical protein